jgi:hypothetical protein
MKFMYGENEETVNDPMSTSVLLVFLPASLLYWCSAPRGTLAWLEM